MTQQRFGWIDWVVGAVALFGVYKVAMFGPQVAWPLEELVATREARAALTPLARAALAPWMAPMATLPLVALLVTSIAAPLQHAERRGLLALTSCLAWGALLLWHKAVFFTLIHCWQ